MNGKQKIRATRVFVMLALAAVITAAVSFAQTEPAADTAGTAADAQPATLAQSSLDTSAYSKNLAEALGGTPVGDAEGRIDPDADKGYLDIPGAPNVNIVLALLWAVWVGWIFSTVGAFGGIMSGVGHITIFGLADYSKTFKDTNPALNKLLTDSIRVSNQWLVGLSGLISSMNYYRMGRLVLPLAICLAIGSVGGSMLIPIITAGKIKLSSYIGYFGLIVLTLAGFLIYKITPRGQASQRAAKEAAAAFESAVRENKDSTDAGVKVTKWSPALIEFTFYGVEFKFKPVLPVLGGLCIAAIASFLGVGGGFLLVPFMTAVVGLPMFLVAGTSALTVLIGMVVSIFTYMFIKGVPVHWMLIGVELVGIFIGSMIGPRTSKYIPDKWLQIIFIILALYVGIRYTTKGFLGTSIVPPF